MLTVGLERVKDLSVSADRRFGKSMAATMLSAYYDKSCDSGKLFSHLEIAKDESYAQNLNQYDVIFLNVQKFLRKAGEPKNLVRYMEDKVLSEIKCRYGRFIDKNEVSLPDALEAVYANDNSANKGFVFIIDEWDCIFRVAKDDTRAQETYLDFLGSFQRQNLC